MAELSPLRGRPIEDMTVRNMSPATPRSYIAAVSRFSRHFGRSSERLDLEDFRKPPVKHADQAGRGFFAAGFRDQRLASAATFAFSGSASKACGSKSSPTHSRISAWRSWSGSARASSISS